MKTFIKILTLICLFSVVSVFAKGDVIGYWQTWNTSPSSVQLNSMTHIIVFSLMANSNGTVGTQCINSNYANYPAQFKQSNPDIKVIIAIGGAAGQCGDPSAGFPQAAGSARTAFVNSIVKFMNDYGYDGVDLDWEFPQNSTDWNNCVETIKAIKAAAPAKRVSLAVSGHLPTTGDPASSGWNGYSPGIPAQLLQHADAVHLMSYDMGGDCVLCWGDHADVQKARTLLTAWANINSSAKEKLILGLPFYSSNWTLWSANQNLSDGISISRAKQQTEYVYNNGYGGIMFWELGYDLNANNNNSLLKNIADETKRINGGKLGGGGGVIIPDPGPFTITASVSGGNGTIAPSGITVKNKGESQEYTFTPNAGYAVNQVLVNGSPVSPVNNKYTISNITENKNITVSFKSAGSGGCAGYSVEVINGTASWRDDGGSSICLDASGWWVTVTANAATTGQTFTGWTIESTGETPNVNTNSDVIEFAMVAANLKFKANYSGTIQTNQAPTDISLAQNSLTAPVAAATAVGILSNTDFDAGTYTYTLVSGIGSNDNAKFAISGTNLNTNTVLPAGTTAYSVRIRVTDSQSTSNPNYFEKSLNITVLSSGGTEGECLTLLNYASWKAKYADWNSVVTGERITENGRVYSVKDKGWAHQYSPTDANGTFGWTDEGDCGETPIITYTVTFNSNGGSSIAAQSDIQSGNTAVKPADPTRNGYDFENWYSNAGLTNPFDFATAITENITLYAKWTAVLVTNNTPTDILLEENSLFAPVSIGAAVGILSAVDADDGNYEYMLVNGQGSSDNGRFVVDGNTLKSGSTVLNSGTYRVRIQVEDSKSTEINNTFTKRFTITVSDAPIVKYKITALVDGGNGIISPSGESEYAENSTPEYTFIPDDGYEIDEVRVDDEIVEIDGNSYTFGEITENRTISVSFKQVIIDEPVYKLTIDGENGFIMLESEGAYAPLPDNFAYYKEGDIVCIFGEGPVGGSLSFSHWEFSTDVEFLNGSDEKTAGLLWFVMPAEDVDAEVIIKNNAVRILKFAVINENGSVFAIDNDGNEINSGDEVIAYESQIQYGNEYYEFALTAVPDAGYRIKEWKINGEIVPNNSENILIVTFENYDELDISAEFELDDDTSVKNGEKSRNSSIKILPGSIVSEKAEIRINLPNKEISGETRIVIYDNSGNVVYSANSQNGKFVWDLTNGAGRFAANGSYLVIAEVKTVNGKIYRYSAKLGVKR